MPDIETYKNPKREADTMNNPILNGIMGLVIGDALGVPVEFIILLPYLLYQIGN